MVVAAGAGELPDGLVGQRVDLQDSLAGAALRTGRTLRLEDEPNRARFERHGLGRLGVQASAGLVVPLHLPRPGLRGADRGRPARRTDRRSPPRTSACWRRSRPARRPRSRPPRRSRPSAAANGWRRPSRNARAGPASCTTRPSRASPRCGSGSPPSSRVQARGDDRGGPRRRRPARAARSHACARSSPTCAPPRSTTSALRPRSRTSPSARDATGSRSISPSTSPTSRAASRTGP